MYRLQRKLACLSLVSAVALGSLQQRTQPIFIVSPRRWPLIARRRHM